MTEQNDTLPTPEDMDNAMANYFTRQAYDIECVNKLTSIIADHSKQTNGDNGNFLNMFIKIFNATNTTQIGLSS